MIDTERTPQSPSSNAAPLLPNAHSGSRIWTILSKEFREIFRERRTVMSVIIGPLFLTPALFALMGVLIGDQVKDARTKTYSIGIVGTIPGGLTAAAGASHLRLVPTTRAAAEAQIKDHDVRAVVVLPPAMEAQLTAGRAASIEILEDAGDDASQTATGRVHTLFDQAGQMLAVQRLRAKNLPAEYATPFVVKDTPIKSGGSLAMLFLAQMLPYLLIISAFSGTIYAAFDTVAGEKERGTLETLLVSPASRRDIVLGKFGSVVAVCLISSLLSITGLAIVFGSGLKAFSALGQGGLHLSAAAIGVILSALLPLAVLFAGLLLAVSTFARNQKEAQTLLAPMFTLVLVPAMMSMFIPTDSSKLLAFVPVLNASLIIKQALGGSFNIAFIAMAFGASVVYAGIALFVATQMFQKESVLIKA